MEHRLTCHGRDGYVSVAELSESCAPRCVDKGSHRTPMKLVRGVQCRVMNAGRWAGERHRKEIGAVDTA